MPFQWRIKQLGSILAGRGVERCLVVASACPSAQATVDLVRDSLRKTSISFIQRQMADNQWPTADFVDGMARDVRDDGGQAVVGVGADGVLDAAKATSLLAYVQQGGTPSSAEQFLGHGPDGAAPTCSRLPMVAVVTRPTLASASGRCLLWHDGQLVPLRIAGTGSHLGIGPGLPPTVAIVDQLALGFRRGGSRSVGPMEEQSNLCVGASALAAIVDMRLATAGTIKALMLEEAAATGVTSIRSVLADPMHCAVDGLLATQVAAIACLDSDATAYGKVSTIHALACAAVGSLPPSEARPAGCVPYSSLCCAFLPAVLRAVAANGSEAEQHAMTSLASTLLWRPRDATATEDDSTAPAATALDLARYLEGRYAELRMPSVRQLLLGRASTNVDGVQDGGGGGARAEGERYLANLISISVWNHALVRRNGARQLPLWFDDIDDVMAVVRRAVDDNEH